MVASRERYIEEEATAPTSVGAVPPSVCFVATSPAMPRALTGRGPGLIGGAELQMAMLGRHLASAGWRVVFLVGDFGQEAHLQTEEGILIRKAWRQRRLPGLIGTVCESLPDLWRALKWADADVYLMRGADSQVGVVAWFAKRAGRSFVYQLAELPDTLAKPSMDVRMGALARRLCLSGLRNASMVVAQTEEQRRLLRDHTGVEAEVVRNPCELGPAPGEKLTEPLVIWVGGLRPVKRPRMFLEVARRLPDVDFLMAGPPLAEYGDLAHRVHDEAQKLPNLRMLGLVPHAELQDTLRRAHVLVSTSRHEGSPNVFLEAWASATPVVSTVDPDDIIKQHGLGFHCADAAEMAAKTRLLCTDGALRNRMGWRGRKYVESEHAAQVVLPRYEAVLRGACRRA